MQATRTRAGECARLLRSEERGEDGFTVAFQSDGKARACAWAIQRTLLARNDGATERVKVRMGLHAGEVIKEGEDFFGRNVIMAARVASQASGGEILTSAW